MIKIDSSIEFNLLPGPIPPDFVIAKAPVEFTDPQTFEDTAIAAFRVSSLEAVGTVTLTPEGGDVPGDGWVAGFVQAAFISSRWALYKGREERDGSTFVELSQPPAMPNPYCDDAPRAGDPFYGTGYKPLAPSTGGPELSTTADLPASSTFPLTVPIIHRDTPSDWFRLSRVNKSADKKTNYLVEAKITQRFCTALVIRTSDDIKYLQYFYWDLVWWYRFSIPDTRGGIIVTPVKLTSIEEPKVLDGEPEPQFKALLNTRQPMNCNYMLYNAKRRPNVTERNVWADFGVANARR